MAPHYQQKHQRAYPLLLEHVVSREKHQVTGAAKDLSQTATAHVGWRSVVRKVSRRTMDVAKDWNRKRHVLAADARRRVSVPGLKRPWKQDGFSVLTQSVPGK